MEKFANKYNFKIKVSKFDEIFTNWLHRHELIISTASTSLYDCALLNQNVIVIDQLSPERKKHGNLYLDDFDPILKFFTRPKTLKEFEKKIYKNNRVKINKNLKKLLYNEVNYPYHVNSLEKISNYFIKNESKEINYNFYKHLKQRLFIFSQNFIAFKFLIKKILGFREVGSIFSLGFLDIKKLNNYLIKSTMKKKIGMIIQARMSSTRLPGKVMKKILGKPLIYRIIERVKPCKRLNQIIIAIPSSKSDDILFKYLKKLNINIFRGSENNLIKRYYLAAKKYNLNYIVRLPADNPLPDFKEIDKLIYFHMKKNNKNIFSSNLQPIEKSDYIDGIGAEIFSIEMLEQLMKNKKLKINKEHIALNFYDFKNKKPVNKNFFKISYPISPKSISYPNIVLDVNYKKQFNFINKIYRNLYFKKIFFNTRYN